MDPAGFSFGEASEETVAQAAVAMPQTEQWLIVGACWAALLALVYLTVRLSMRPGPGKTFPRLEELPPVLRCVAIMAFVSICFVQVLGATNAYVHTRVVNDNLTSYFQYLSWAKLIGISHSHIFGFFVIYSVLGLLLACSYASERVKCYLVSFALWAGIFDVGSWWLIKQYSSTFEYVSMAAASASGLTTLLTFYFLTQSFWRAIRNA